VSGLSTDETKSNATKANLKKDYSRVWSPTAVSKTERTYYGVMDRLRFLKIYHSTVEKLNTKITKRKNLNYIMPKMIATVLYTSDTCNSYTYTTTKATYWSSSKVKVVGQSSTSQDEAK